MDDSEALLEALQSPELKEILSLASCEYKIEHLKRTVLIAQDVLQKAERKQTLSLVEQQLIQYLKHAVSVARRVVDNYVTISKQELSGRARPFSFHKSPRFDRAYYLFKEFENIWEKLDSIAYNLQFGFEHDPELIRKSIRRETCSLVEAGEIIGREEDLEKIVNMLLNSNSEQDVCFLSIVGICGLGKTTLAQLVFKDTRVTSAFSVRRWACVSNADRKHLDMKEVQGKILDSENVDEGKLQQHLSGKRFLVVLDDVWVENGDQWRSLVQCFNGGQRGSWIVVTTRSEMTAKIIGYKACQIMYKLNALSKEDSWRLFERTTFVPGKLNLSFSDDLVKLGLEFVDGCGQVPLAITLLGNFLYDQDESKWQLVKKIGLANMCMSEDSIKSIFQLIYYHLNPTMKIYFNYCALFPKDFEISVEKLISLWMAQNNTGLSCLHSYEDMYYIVFHFLLSKGFFQDIKRDKYGDIVSCKTQHFMHALAQNVTKNEIYAMRDFRDDVDQGFRHISFVSAQQWLGSNFLGNINIWSFLHVGYNDFQGCKVTNSSLKSLLEKCRNLRALDLSGLLFKSLPDSIGDLRDLAYLNLSGNTVIEVLPEEITTLMSLRAINLEECVKLKRLPNDFSRLRELNLLNIKSCSSLTCMPKGIGNLTCLRSLSNFMVGDKGSNSSWKQLFDALEDLKPLDKLGGCLSIEIRCPNANKYVSKEDAMRKESYPLRSKEHLKAIELYFKEAEVYEGLDIEEVTRLMKELEPHPNLQYLKVWRYNGVRLGWDTFPENLVELEMVGCWELTFLPCMGNLPCMKVLKLSNLKKLEYIFLHAPWLYSRSVHISSYYPSLETLRLENLPMLKGWRSEEVGDHRRQEKWKLLFRFSRLKSLFIWNCQELTWIPPCPAVEDLKLAHFSTKLRIVKSTARGEHVIDVASSSATCNDINIPESSSSHSCIQNGKKIRKVAISNVAWLNWLPTEAFDCLENLEIWCDKEVESLTEVEELFRSCLSSLKFLIIHNNSNLKSVVPGGLKHLTALEKLELRNCDNLTLSEDQGEGEGEEREDGVDIGLVKWSSNFHALRNLKLEGLPQLVNLPDWMQFLSALKTLCIINCCGLKSLPTWMTQLTSLEQLAVISCSAILERRCKKNPPGEDWPYIQHIPSIEFRDCGF